MVARGIGQLPEGVVRRIPVPELLITAAGLLVDTPAEDNLGSERECSQENEGRYCGRPGTHFS